jgi:glycerol kinase
MSRQARNILAIDQGTTGSTALVMSTDGETLGRSNREFPQHRECPHPLRRMRVDGGAAANDALMQFQSDVSDLVVERPVELESTARGAARLAGVAVGLSQTAPKHRK